MKFFWVKLHIEFTFYYRDPYGSGVACPWIFYYRTYACNSFPGFFSTPFHIGTWNFPWGSSELCDTSSSSFIIVTPMVPELCALRFFTIRHACNSFPVFFFSTPSHNGTWNFPWGSSELSYTHHRDPYGSGVACPWIFYYSTYACNSFPGYFSTPFHIGTWNFPWSSSELSYTSSSRFIVVTPMVPELRALRFFLL
jgi:hypothetical protein